MQHARRTSVGLLRRAGWLFVATAGLSANVHADCKLMRLAELPVTMVDLKPMVTAKINGVDVHFVADSGAFFSTLTQASAAQLRLKTHPAPFGLRVTGIGGDAGMSVATVDEFTLAGVPLKHVEFLVGGGEAGGGSVGLLGQNVFRIGDVEYDLAHGVIRLMREDGCNKATLAYWIHSPAEPFSRMDIQSTTPLVPHTIGTATLNGVKIRVVFDTGADTSVLSMHAAQRAGIKIDTQGADTPGVTYAGYSRGIGRDLVKTWIVPVASFKLGDNEEIHNTRLRVGETVVDFADMLIGADFFLSHHVYVASKQGTLYFTYNGGPVFNLAAKGQARGEPPAGTPVGASAEAAGQAAAQVAGETPPAPADQPKDAAEFSRRGSAYAARRDFEHAIADLTRACELAPTEPDYFYERGIALLENREPLPALADLDRALTLRPDHLPALVTRAELRLARSDTRLATADLDAADRAAPPEADIRLQMAMAYLRADLPEPAIRQLDQWIGAHAADSRSGGALTERCWARALTGQDLDKALDDCSTALKRGDKKNASSARVYAGRGLVRLRLGNYDKSLVDYDAALALRPRDAWALYGRGIDNLRRGKTGEGRADMAAATAIWPGVEAAFKTRGLGE